MKLWEKVYLVTLAVAIICVNIGVYGIFHVTYKQMLNTERIHCEDEFATLQKSLSDNVSELTESVSFSETYFKKFLSAYSSYYDDNVTLYGQRYRNIWYYGNYSIKNFDKTEFFKDFSEAGVTVTDEDGTVVYIAAPLNEKYKAYRIIMRWELTDFDATWNVLFPLYIIGSIVLSIVIAFALGMVVKRLFKRVDVLTDAVTDMASGNLSRRIEIEGNDELAVLGNEFNGMAEALGNNMKLLKDEARKKQQLIDDLAHEMNTPITSIQGFANYIQIGNVEENEQRECIEFILKEAGRLKNISSTLLEMAKLNHSDITMEMFSMRELCGELETLMRRKCEEKDITFTSVCTVDNFYGNRVLIESLIRNLTSNAVNAVGENGNITVAAQICKKNDADTLIIEVTDDGCGIPPEEADNIFEPFYRVDKSRSRAHGGSGLGLPLCKLIAELHGGEIYLNQNESGTTMTVELPVKEEPADEPENEEINEEDKNEEK